MYVYSVPEDVPTFEELQNARWRRYFCIFLWALLALTILADISPAQTITVQPANQIVMAGTPATLTISFTSGPCHSVFYTNTPLGNFYGPVSGSPMSYSFPAVTEAMSGDFVQIILYSCAGGPATPLSSVAVLTITPAVALSSLAISPASLNLTVGRTANLVATGTYADSSIYNDTPSATWVSDMPSVATVNSGVVTAVGGGTANVTATLNGISSTSVLVTVSLSTVTLTINPGSKAIFDDGSAILPGPIVLQEAVGNIGLFLPAGTITSDSSGNLSGSIIADPNSINLDANGNVVLVFGIPAIPNALIYPVPAASFEQGASGLTLQLVLYRKALVVKSQTIALTP